jgi:beta-mannosidase
MKTISLHGSWKLRNRNGRIKTSAQIPGDTHSALLQTGQIPDPYWAENELKVQGLGWEDWIYERSFDVPASVLKEVSVFLNCENVDTVSAIYLNGQKVAQTRNAFVRFRFEVKKYLRVGRNELRIELFSPEKAARVENKKLPYPIPHNQFPIQAQHRNLLRKVQCHAGWDWGPCLMVSGLYGDIYLGATSLGRIEYVTTEQKHRKGGVEVVVSCEVLSPQGGATAFEIKLGRQTVVQKIHLEPGLNVCFAADDSGGKTAIVVAERLWRPSALRSDRDGGRRHSKKTAGSAYDRGGEQRG